MDQFGRRFRNSPAHGLPAPGNMPRDPRGFAQAYGDHGVQGDVLRQQKLRQDIARDGLAPFEQIVDEAAALNLPPQLVQVSFFCIIPEWGFKGRSLLIPKNPRRKAYLVSNFLGANQLMFSWDAPIDAGQNIGAGVPVGNYYQESNGSITINDVWVFCNDSAETFPMFILGYEGEISIAGNKRG